MSKTSKVFSNKIKRDSRKIKREIRLIKKLRDKSKRR